MAFLGLNLVGYKSALGFTGLLWLYLFFLVN